MLEATQRQQTSAASTTESAAKSSGGAKARARGLADQGFAVQERALSPDGAAADKADKAPPTRQGQVQTTAPITLYGRTGNGQFTLGKNSRVRVAGEVEESCDAGPFETVPIVIEDIIRIDDGGSVWFADIRDNHVENNALYRDHYGTKVRGYSCTVIAGSQFDPVFTWPTGKAEDGQAQSKRCITKGRVAAPMSGLFEWRMAVSDLETKTSAGRGK